MSNVFDMTLRNLCQTVIHVTFIPLPLATALNYGISFYNIKIKTPPYPGTLNF